MYVSYPLALPIYNSNFFCLLVSLTAYFPCGEYVQLPMHTDLFRERAPDVPAR
jgi:hypothetical protein